MVVMMTLTGAQTTDPQATETCFAPDAQNLSRQEAEIRQQDLMYFRHLWLALASRDYETDQSVTPNQHDKLDQIVCWFWQLLRTMVATHLQ
jgi:hypothetical protein